jgi:hypothetical protein
MSDFAAYVKRFIVSALERIPATTASDVYVVSLYVEDRTNRDPRSPQVEIGFNTEVRAAQTTPASGQAPGWPIASDAAEARWNFAFWLQNDLAHLGHSDRDPEGFVLAQEWVRGLGLWYSDEDEEFGYAHEASPEAKVVVDKMDTIDARWIDLLADVVRGLHQDGLIVRVFGRPIPVLIHELEYYDEIADRARSANPSDLVDDFCAWIEGMYQRELESRPGLSAD